MMSGPGRTEASSKDSGGSGVGSVAAAARRLTSSMARPDGGGEP
jgi:hypothetical protein